MTDLENRADAVSAAFGTAIRDRRTTVGMTQDQLALATGVGRRFLIDLEAGKRSCQLGRSILVAEALGIRLVDILRQANTQTPSTDELPSLLP